MNGFKEAHYQVVTLDHLGATIACGKAPRNHYLAHNHTISLSRCRDRDLKDQSGTGGIVFFMFVPWQGSSHLLR